MNFKIVKKIILSISAILYLTHCSNQIELIYASEYYGWAEVDGTAYIISYHGKESELVIPDTIYGKKVTEIEKNCFKGNSEITKITIPNTVTKIGDSAFENCSNLKEINIPNSVNQIGAYTFSNTKWLDNQKENNPLVIVNNTIVDGTTCSGEVIIPDNVTNICSAAFLNANSITGVKMSNNVISIGNAAFAGCTSIREVTVSGHLNSILSYSFENCKNLREISIPSSVTEIGEFAFRNCNSLSKIIIANNTITIRSTAFDYCDNLIIYGNDDSYAHEYAEKYNKRFSLINSVPYDSNNNSSINGDIDCNGMISVSDFVELIGIIQVGDASKILLADLNNDDTVNMMDVICLKEILLR